MPLSEEVTPNSFSITEETAEIRSCQLRLVKLFQAVCEKHGLRFWAEAGTLLGAARHQGYIPWDDDIDLVMMRDDFDRLVKIAGKEFRKPYVFQTPYTEKHYVRGHAQLRDMRTCAILPEEIYKDFNQGIFIDIFVLDFIPDNDRQREILQWCAAFDKERLEIRNRPLRYFRDDREKLKLALKYRLKYPLAWGRHRLYRRYEKRFRKVNPAECANVSTAAWISRSYLRPKEYYNETVQLDFEGMKLPAPKEWEKILELQYGKDWRIPKMVSTLHGEVIFDTETPADIKIKELRKASK